jgi:hypothetical protein
LSGRAIVVFFAVITCLAPVLTLVLPPFGHQLASVFLLLLLAPVVIALSAGLALGFGWACGDAAVRSWLLGALGYALPFVAVFLLTIMALSQRCSGTVLGCMLASVFLNALAAFEIVAGIGGTPFLGIGITVGTLLRGPSRR